MPGDETTGTVFTSSNASVRPMDQHGQAPGADDLFLAFMKAGQIDAGLVVAPADEALDLFARHVTPPGR